jgi:cytoskeleton protein RodZ
LAKIESRPRPSKPDSANNLDFAEHKPALPPSLPGKEAMGGLLKAARLAAKIPLQQAAQDTRISFRHLQSLEEGRYQDLPGGMYNRAFVKCYGAYLGLDAESLLRKYEQELEPHVDKVARARTPDPYVSQEPFRFPPVLVWSLMFLVSVAGLWFTRSWIAAVFSPYFSRPPASRMETREPSRPLVQQPAGEQASAPAATPALPPATPPADAAAASVSVQASLEKPLAGALQLRVDTVEPCWISVNGDGRRLLSKLLQPGEGQSFAANTDFNLILGNAGGVKLKINGKPVKSLGPSGSVVRFSINADNIPNLLEKLTG